MKILVTGGAGYIGSHTCVQLLEGGHRLIIVDNFSNSKPDALQAIRTITGSDFAFREADIRDREAMERIFAQEKPEAVIHFAGLKAVAESVGKPLLYYDNNLTGSLVLFETMQRHSVKKIVFSSSATVYGMNNPMPVREEYPTSAINPYGYTKVVIERMLMDLAVSDPSWSISLLRYFNPVGAHESGLIGEDPNDTPNNLMPYVAMVAAGKLPLVHVYGNDYETEDGTGVRDYIHVLDLAAGHLAALEYIAGHTGVEAVNLGTGQGQSVLQMIHAFEEASGRKIPYDIRERRPGDIAACFADVSKAKRMLGFEAKRPLAKMCEDAWRFAEGRY